MRNWFVAVLMGASALSLVAPAQAEPDRDQGRGRWNAGARPNVSHGDGGQRPQWNGGARNSTPATPSPQVNTQSRAQWRQDRSDGGQSWRQDGDRRGQGWQQQPPQQRVAQDRSDRDGSNDGADRRSWNGSGNGGIASSRPAWNGNDRRDWRNDRERNGGRDRDNDRDRDWNRGRGHDRAVRYSWDRASQRDWRNRGGDRDSWRRPGYEWNRDWRRDQRYNWERYRASNRYIYRLPRYYAPYGWDYGYRSFSIGVTLWGGLYDEAYWIDDPYYYRLPAAYGSLRWVRYFDDALLVDIRTGYVVDVIHNFFW